ncbi:hypothetical protein [Reinekea blandensis]|uniref:hypothetical protein n=1 Tax=Reinekea blandensis TaxID=374838 RepID=UPI00031E5F74|nr:hypothetical protein [Reinekea blandensis]
MFDSGSFQLPLQVVNQTDRIQGMARYMNSEGASSEIMNVLLFLAVMVSVVLILRMVHRHHQKKQARIRAARKQKTEPVANAPKPASRRRS